jgi:RTX calcium-binding nonapeptide repeat (4 copies)
VRLATSLALAALAALPASAGAHSLVRTSGATLRYISADATSLNTLSVGGDARRLALRDPSVDGGMDFGSCTPGDTTNDANAWVIEAFCPRAGVRRLQLEMGEREDSVSVGVPIAATIFGGPGADRITGGPANDAITGDEGADTVRAGAGDDEVRLRDGIADLVRCGPGNDRVLADTFDDVGEDCESVQRALVAAPPGGGATGDRVAPQLRVGARAVQRIARTRRIRLAAVTSEPGLVAASGFLDVGGLSLPLQGSRERVAVPGGGAEIRVTLTRSQRRRALRALRARRRVVIRLGVVATDAAGNSRRRDAPPIRLRR